MEWNIDIASSLSSRKGLQRDKSNRGVSISKDRGRIEAALNVTYPAANTDHQTSEVVRALEQYEGIGHSNETLKQWGNMERLLNWGSLEERSESEDIVRRSVAEGLSVAEEYTPMNFRQTFVVSAVNISGITLTCTMLEPGLATCSVRFKTQDAGFVRSLERRVAYKSYGTGSSGNTAVKLQFPGTAAVGRKGMAMASLISDDKNINCFATFVNLSYTRLLFTLIGCNTILKLRMTRRSVELLAMRYRSVNNDAFAVEANGLKIYSWDRKPNDISHILTSLDGTVLYRGTPSNIEPTFKVLKDMVQTTLKSKDSLRVFVSSLTTI